MYLSVSTNEPLSFTKEDRLNKVYDSDREQAPKILNGSLFSYTYERLEIFLP